MVVPWGAIATGLGSIAGGLIGAKGQRDANKANIQLAREQMAFQERMSSTAYERATRDLEAAGLNRILALGSPASSPAGARPQIMNELAPLGQGVADAMPNAFQAQQTQAQTGQLRQLTKNAKAIRTNIALEAGKLANEIQLVSRQTDSQSAQAELSRMAKDLVKTLEQWVKNDSESWRQKAIKATSGMMLETEHMLDRLRNELGNAMGDQQRSLTKRLDRLEELFEAYAKYGAPGLILELNE